MLVILERDLISGGEGILGGGGEEEVPGLERELEGLVGGEMAPNK